MVAVAAENDAGSEKNGNEKKTALPEVVIKGAKDNGDLSKPYAGGQVARGGRLGLLGSKDVMDTPFNMTSYTAQTIEDQQARTLADVANSNPTVRAIYTESDGLMDFVVRGNKIKGLDVGYDGLYGIGTPGIESLERIEILSGANALLNGLGPVGGVGGMINQVPKKALETPLTRFTTGYFSDSQFLGQIDLSRRFGADRQIGVRFNAAYRKGDTAVDKQSQEVSTAVMAIDYRSEQFRISSNFGFRHNATHMPSRTTYIAAGFDIPAPPGDPKFSWQQPWSYDVTDTTFGTLKAEYDITQDVSAYASWGASQFREKQLFANSQLLTAAGALAQRHVYWPLYRDSATAELGFKGKLNTGEVKHTWSVAASGLQIKNGILLNTVAQNATNIYAPVFIPEPNISSLAGPENVPKTGETNLSSLALADTLSFADDRIQVIIGVRQQQVGVKNFNPANGVVTSRYDKSAVTPGVGVVFKPVNNVSVYANYIEGLQQGPVAPVGTKNAGEIFSPYVSKQYETGVKVDFGKLMATLSVYQLTTPNGYTNPGTLVYGIDGEQKTKGLELNTFGEIYPGLRLLGGAAFVDAKQSKTAGGVNNGKKVTGVPDVQVNLGLEWDPGFAPGLTLTGRVIHTDSQYLDVINKQSVPSWKRFDLGARYLTVVSGYPTTFRLNVENAANKSYWAEAIDGYVVQSKPRTVSLSATVDF
ncbi:TonB-dependent receptor [Undibacterium sp. Tian12W]